MADLITSLGQIPANLIAANQRALTRAALLVHRESIRNAPRSPSVGQRNALRKTTSDTSKSKKPRAFSRAKPGGLERSISFEVKNTFARVFVAQNSEAGKYAAYIHDEKDSEWSERGAGTIAKGERSDDKFIERAITDNQDAMKAIFASELAKALKL